MQSFKNEINTHPYDHVVVSRLQAIQNNKDEYPLLACSFSAHEVVLANSDMTLSLMDLNQMVIQPFDNTKGHKSKIESLCCG
jgi:hypothetical protein